MALSGLLDLLTTDNLIILVVAPLVVFVLFRLLQRCIRSNDPWGMDWNSDWGEDDENASASADDRRN